MSLFVCCRHHGAYEGMVFSCIIPSYLVDNDFFGEGEKKIFDDFFLFIFGLFGGILWKLLGHLGHLAQLAQGQGAMWANLDALTTSDLWVGFLKFRWLDILEFAWLHAGGSSLTEKIPQNLKNPKKCLLCSR
jgi:hypothetical protein